MKQTLFNYLKNISGKKINRKLVAFAVDDYGNVRVHSKEALNRLEKLGVSTNNRFDQFDALDTTEDYQILFEVLRSVRDKNGNNAIFTTYALPCNTDFQATLTQRRFVPEDLPTTYSKLSAEQPAYESAYEILLEGINNKLIKPQFHGREHLNVQLINALIEQQEPSVMANLENQSMVGLASISKWPTISYNQAFSFWEKSDLEAQKFILKDGLERFKNVYGYASLTFTPPALQLHPSLYGYVGDHGVIGVDRSRAELVHLGVGKFQKCNNQLGQKDLGGTIKIVRNCVFEPNDRNIDWASFTMKQIEAAFFWGKPAIISSHRVNFCGHIDPKNRAKGISDLKNLLNKIVQKWPDVEFMGVDEIAKIYANA
jgi:hypothetical protein